jgi:hypothetical protein
MSQFEFKDTLVIGSGIVAGLLTALYGMQVGEITFLGVPPLQLEIWFSYGLVIPIPFALYFIYKAEGLWGGKIGRAMESIAIGLTVTMIIHIPHIYWHILGEPTEQALPAWGISKNFWYVFYHGLSGLSFFMLSYGFYLFSKAGE